MSRWSPAVQPIPERNHGAELASALADVADQLLAKRERDKERGERDKDREREDAYRQQVLQRQDEERQYRQGRDAEADAARRAELARQGILYKPNPSSVYEGTGEQVDVPTVPGLMQGFKMEGVRTRPGMRVLGGGYYEDEARTPEARERAIAAAAKAKEMRDRRAALIARGYDPASAELVLQGLVDATDTGPIAEERTNRDVREYRGTTLARELAGEADGGLKPIDAARVVSEYDEGTNQQLKLADQLIPNDPYWRPRTAADSANVTSADSLRNEARGRMAHRPSTQGIIDLFGRRGRTMTDTSGVRGTGPAVPAPAGRGGSPVGPVRLGGNRMPTVTEQGASTKTPAQWVSEVRGEHPTWTAEQVAAEARKRAGL